MRISAAPKVVNVIAKVTVWRPKSHYIWQEGLNIMQFLLETYENTFPVLISVPTVKSTGKMEKPGAPMLLQAGRSSSSLEFEPLSLREKSPALT